MDIKQTSGPVIERQADLSAILTSLEEHDVLFIDEIHRLNHAVEETLYSAMEDFEVDIMLGKGPTARSMKIGLKPFTLIGATTRSGLLTPPLRARFRRYLPLRFLFARGTRVHRGALGAHPRRAHRGRRRARDRRALAGHGRASPTGCCAAVRDYAQVKGDGVITRPIADAALKLLRIDALGLDDMDRLIVETVIEKFAGGPVGLSSMAVAVGEERQTLEEVHEPYLIQIGFIKRTQQGRVATPARLQALRPHPAPREADRTSFSSKAREGKRGDTDEHGPARTKREEAGLEVSAIRSLPRSSVGAERNNTMRSHGGPWERARYAQRPDVHFVHNVHFVH